MTLDQPVSPLAETSTLYPVIVPVGAVQESLISVSPAALAVRPVGASGAMAVSVSVRGTLSPVVQLSPELLQYLEVAALLSASSKAKAVPSTLSVRVCEAVVRVVSKMASNLPFVRRKMAVNA